MLMAFIADLHAGASGGVWHPDTKLARCERPSRANQTWNLFDETLKISAKNYAAEVETLVVVGDAIHGTKFRENTAVDNIGDQVTIAADAIEYAATVLGAKKIVSVPGTPVHDYDGGCLIDALTARGLDAIDADVHPVFKHGAYAIDVAHHGAAINLLRAPINAASAAFNYCASMTLNGLDVPDVIVRAHRHNAAMAEILFRDKRVTYIALPPMVMPDMYAVKVTNSVPFTRLGLAIIEIGAKIKADLVLSRVIDTRCHIKL